MNNNKVNLVGDVVSDFEYSHAYANESFYRFYIGARRTSGISDILPVMVSNRIMDKAVDMKGMRVEVSGSFRSRNVLGEDGRSHLELCIWAETVNLSNKDYENHIEFDGYICKIPTLRDTPFGRKISDAIIAVNRRVSKADYLPVIAWSRDAVYLSNLCVGTQLSIKGRVQSRTYMKQIINDEYEQRIAYEVSVSVIDAGSGENGKYNDHPTEEGRIL